MRQMWGVMRPNNEVVNSPKQSSAHVWHGEWEERGLSCVRCCPLRAEIVAIGLCTQVCVPLVCESNRRDGASSTLQALRSPWSLLVCTVCTIDFKVWCELQERTTQTCLHASPGYTPWAHLFT